MLTCLRVIHTETSFHLNPYIYIWIQYLFCYFNSNPIHIQEFKRHSKFRYEWRSTLPPTYSPVDGSLFRQTDRRLPLSSPAESLRETSHWPGEHEWKTAEDFFTLSKHSNRAVTFTHARAHTHTHKHTHTHTQHTQNQRSIKKTQALRITHHHTQPLCATNTKRGEFMGK